MRATRLTAMKSKATVKKEGFEADDAKRSSKLEAAVDGETSTLQSELGVFSERQLQMDTTRADERLPRLRGTYDPDSAENYGCSTVAVPEQG